MKRILLTILFIAHCLISTAAAIKFTANVSSDVVEVGQRIQITFTVNSKGGSFTPPSFPKLRLLSGPNQSQNMQYANGQMSQSTSISYVFQTTEKGKINIGPASIVVSGKSYETKPLKIEVVAASANSTNAQRNRQNQRKSDGKQLTEYVFIKSFVDKKSAYVGEKITVTYKLYSKLSLTGINLEEPAAFNGFWTQDLRTLYDQIQLKREQYNGEIYNVAELQQTLLFPQRSGDLVVGPMSMKVSVQVQSKRARSVFEQMFGSYENKTLIAKSDPISIKVKALPSKGKPAGFSGAVGSFSMKMTANKDTVPSNEAIDVKIVVKGSGNLPLISAPDLNFPPDFEVYDPETKDKYKTSATGAKGSKSYNYLVIPRHSGSFKLDPYSFSYFDLASKTYKTIKADPISIEVTKGVDEENVVYSPSRKEDIELLNTDIRYIHLNNLMLSSSAGFFYKSTLFFSLIAIALILIIALYFISKKLKLRNADQVGIRKSKANKLAKKRLAKAKAHLDNNDKASFYEEISSALHGYFADKFNISIAELSQEKIIDLLEDLSGSEAIRTETRTVLEEAEMARFAPESSINTTILYEKSADIIRKMEDLKS